MIDINHPSIRHAQYLADKNKQSYCLLKNDFGGYDIKSTDSVSPYVDSLIVAEIRPKTREIVNE